MKKFFYLLLLMCAASCAKSDLEQSDLVAEEPEQTTRTAGDGAYDVLGYGYDVCGDYLAHESIRRQVVNIAAVLADYSKDDGYYDDPFIGETKARTIATNDAVDFLKEIKKNSKIEGSRAVSSLGPVPTLFSGTLNRDSSSGSTYNVKTERSYARIESVKRLKQLVVHLEPQILKNYLMPAFLNDLNTLSASEIVKRYGTHVMTDIEVGGRFRADYSSVIMEQTSTKSKTVTAGAKISLLGIIDFGGNMTETEATTLNKSNKEWVCEIKTIGGTQSGNTVTLTESGISGQTISVGTWEGSVSNTTCRLVDINWDAAYPIFDFVDDPVKKAALKTAVQNHINQQPEIVLLDPLFRYYNARSIDHMYTVRSYELLNNANYAYEWIEGYVFRNRRPGTVPLYRFYLGKPQYNHFYSTSYSEGINAGYTYEEIVGYVYPSLTTNSVPLYRFYKHKTPSDHLYTTNPGRENLSQHVLYGIECYLPLPLGF